MRRIRPTHQVITDERTGLSEVCGGVEILHELRNQMKRQVARGAPIVKRIGDFDDDYSYQIQIFDFITSMNQSQMEKFAAEVCEMLGWVAMTSAFDRRTRRKDDEFQDIEQRLENAFKNIGSLSDEVRRELDNIKRECRTNFSQFNKRIRRFEDVKAAEDALTNGEGGRRLQVDE